MQIINLTQKIKDPLNAYSSVCVYNFQKIIFLWVWEQYINLKKDQASQVKTETLVQDPNLTPKSS